MEFHAIAKVKTTPEALQRRLDIDTLANFSADFSNIADDQADTPWGRFSLHRAAFTGGVRFQLLNCPNGLQWTISAGYPPAPDAVFIHATVNRTEIDPDFAESLQDFVDELRDGLERAY